MAVPQSQHISIEPLLNSRILDATTFAVKTIEYEHYEIHGGNGFLCADVADLAINNVVDLQITTPDTTKWAHMVITFDVESETQWWIYENVTINTAGTAAPVRNRNRNSSTANTTTVAAITNADLTDANADTAIAGATLIAHGIAGTGKGRGGDESARHELILKQNEDYSLRLSASAAGYVDYVLDWYEHSNKV